MCRVNILPEFFNYTPKNDLNISTYVSISEQIQLQQNRFFASSVIRAIHIIIINYFTVKSDTNTHKQMCRYRYLEVLFGIDMQEV